MKMNIQVQNLKRKSHIKYLGKHQLKMRFLIKHTRLLYSCWNDNYGKQTIKSTNFIFSRFSFFFVQLMNELYLIACRIYPNFL
jgi:hypothetical protein